MGFLWSRFFGSGELKPATQSKFPVQHQYPSTLREPAGGAGPRLHHRYRPQRADISYRATTHWIGALADVKARAAIYLRIKRAELGNFGEYKVLDKGVSEMKVDVGPGYRVYFVREGRVTYLLLCGGDKSTQRDDIKRARTIWKTIKEQT